MKGYYALSLVLFLLFACKTIPSHPGEEDKKEIIPPDTVAPEISLTSPEHKAKDIEVTDVIEIFFSEKIDPTSVEVNYKDTVCGGNIQLSRDVFDTCVRFEKAVWVNNKDQSDTLHLTPFIEPPKSPLDYDSSYKLRMLASIKDGSENSLKAKTIAFKTVVDPDKTSPRVVAVVPARQKNISVTTPIELNFSEPMQVGSLTTNSGVDTCSGSVRLYERDTKACVALKQPLLSNENRSAIVALSNKLAANTNYILEVGEVKDDSGNTLVDIYTQAFKTAIDPDVVAPSLKTRGVDLAGQLDRDLVTEVSLEFSEKMSANSLTVNNLTTACSESIQISNNGFKNCAKIIGLSVFDGLTKASLSFEPLVPDTQYKLKVTRAATDFEGNGLDKETIIAFKTRADATPLFILSIDPENEQSGVIVDKVIKINFSRAVLASSIKTQGACSERNIKIYKTDSPTSCLDVEISYSEDKKALSLNLKGGGKFDLTTQYSIEIGATITDIFSRELKVSDSFGETSDEKISRFQTGSEQ
jgi:hypothetical protein